MQVLSIKGLQVSFRKGEDYLKFISALDLDIDSAQIVGIAGESGSGKTVSLLSLTQLLPSDLVKVEFDTYKINQVRVERIQIPYLRGRFISYIFQDPLPSLDPMFTVRYQLKEVFQALDKEVSEEDMLSLLERVGLSESLRALNSYPHQLSGGMAQRVAIALALASKAKVLVADEPTTALDASLKKGILNLLRSLKEQDSLSIFFISHDLNQIFYISDYIYIFYAGRVMEKGPQRELKAHPLHPYTQALLNCIPRRDNFNFIPIPGKSPDIKNLPSGCKFHPRCPYVKSICQKEEPDLIEVKKGHFTRCHLQNNVRNTQSRKNI